MILAANLIGTIGVILVACALVLLIWRRNMRVYLRAYLPLYGTGMLFLGAAHIALIQLHAMSSRYEGVGIFFACAGALALTAAGLARVRR